MNELVKVKHDTDALAKIDQLAKECSLCAVGGAIADGIASSFKMAAAIQAMRTLITPEMMKDIMELQGTRLGFLTDRDDPKSGPPGYPVQVVKDVFIEATLRGARMNGNEVNIIARNCYLTKNFFTRILREFPGLEDFRFSIGVPDRDPKTNRAKVSARATWRLNGRLDGLNRVEAKSADGAVEVDERFIIKFDQYTSDDAIYGKVERKLKAAVLTRITGTVFSDGEAGEEEETPIAGSNGVLLGPTYDSVKAITKTTRERFELQKKDAEATVEKQPAEKQESRNPPKEEAQQEQLSWANEFLDRVAQCNLCSEVTALEKEFLPRCKTQQDRDWMAAAGSEQKAIVKGR